VVDRRPRTEREAADVLAQHVLKVSIGDGCFCTCGGFSVGRGEGASAAQAAHQAEVLQDAGLLSPSSGATE
jgi:hypothetical protein